MRILFYVEMGVGANRFSGELESRRAATNSPSDTILIAPWEPRGIGKYQISDLKGSDKVERGELEVSWLRRGMLQCFRVVDQVGYGFIGRLKGIPAEVGAISTMQVHLASLGVGQR